MKVTIVPAQITTVEDKIAGSLSLVQLMLLMMPLFASCAIFIAIPPFAKFSLIKIILAALCILVCATLAVRIKGTLVCQWVITLGRYMLRPSFYVYDKRARQSPAQHQEAVTPEEEQRIQTHTQKIPLLPISNAEVVAVHGFMQEHAHSLRFASNHKGGLHVRISQAKT